MGECQEQWGYHMTVDGKGANNGIHNESVIRAFVADLIERIGMVAWGPCHVQFFDTSNLNLRGYSAVQLITTSSFTAHFVEHDNTFYIDVFSCKEFDPDCVKATITEYFSPESMHTNYFTRQA